MSGWIRRIQHELHYFQCRRLEIPKSSKKYRGNAMIILAILSFLIYFKAYKTLFQRLYLYLIIATLLNEIAGIISIEHQWCYSGQKTVCRWVGLFTAWTYVQLFIFSYEIIFYLLYLVVSQIRGIQLPHCGWRYSRRCYGVTAEIVYILLPALIATVFALPPYIHDSFGIAGPWCFVRSLNDDCEPSGKVIQMTFYSMYMSLGVAGIVASVIFSIVYFKLANFFNEVRHLLKRTLYILVFKFVHILMIMCSMACRIYTLEYQRHKLYGLWLAHALSVPLGVIVFPLGYFLCFHPVGKIAQKIYKKIAHKCCRHRNAIGEKGITHQQVTAPVSNRVSQPSTTYYVVQHSDVETETTPLIGETRT